MTLFGFWKLGVQSQRFWHPFRQMVCGLIRKQLFEVFLKRSTCRHAIVKNVVNLILGIFVFPPTTPKCMRVVNYKLLFAAQCDNLLKNMNLMA
jgi:hypothetical protein